MNAVGVITRSLDAVTEVNPRKGLVRAIISDDSTDRYRTIFDPHGADYSGFMEAGGPVVYEHGKLAERGNLPVGNVASIERGTFKGRQSLIADTRFWDTDNFSKTIKQAYESMKMRGWSISARPLESSPPTPAEKRSRGEWSEATTVYRSWELLDLSVCSTPGNKNTLTTEVLRSLAAGSPSSYGGKPKMTREEMEQLAREYGTCLARQSSEFVRQLKRVLAQHGR